MSNRKQARRCGGVGVVDLLADAMHGWDISGCGFNFAFTQLCRHCIHEPLISPIRFIPRGGKLAILMGDHQDRDAGFVPLVCHTKRLALELGLRQCATDIIRFSHGASSSGKVCHSSFMPGLHDICMIFTKPAAQA